MARLVWNASYGLDFKGFNLSGIHGGTSFGQTEALFSVYYSYLGTRDDFRGVGFTYGSDVVPDGGTLTSYTVVHAGRKLGFIDGMRVPMSALSAAAQTPSADDDLAVYKLALSHNDLITGGRGPDKLEGFNGNDKITGGLGGDKLYGGAGADAFIFKTVRDTTVSKSGRDTVFDFSHRQKDKLALTSIDADTTHGGNQAFHFIGKEGFHHEAGELRYATSKGYTYVYGDVNGDGHADFLIQLKGALHLVKGDFLL